MAQKHYNHNNTHRQNNSGQNQATETASQQEEPIKITPAVQDCSAKTRLVDEFYIGENAALKELTRKEQLNKLMMQAFAKFELVKKEIEEYLQKNDWMPMSNKPVLYEKKHDMLVPELDKYTVIKRSSGYNITMGGAVNWDFFGFKGASPNKEQAKTIVKYFGLDYIAYYSYEYRWISASGTDRAFNCTDYYSINLVPVRDEVRLKNNILGCLLNLQLKPAILSQVSSVFYDNLLWMAKNNYLTISTQFPLGIKPNSNFAEDVYDGKIINSLNGVDFKENTMSLEIAETATIRDIIFSELLEGDFERAEIEPYDKKWLEDPNMGHWDLWNQKQSGGKIKLAEKIVARNPIADIKENGIIGIDFGTKSTIVVCQDGDETIQPMRVGMGRFSKKVEAKHFENPTVMEFLDLQSFMKDYRARKGRPYTKWEDMTVSHTAFNDLMESKSNDYYAYFNDLKQWAGEKDARIRIKDKKGFECELKSYLSLTDGDFDPIEYYAYYIGLFINNMHNGIYMDYLLSFPVTYEVAVRERILKSFSNGLKKSLPEEVLNDAEQMKNFRVVQGASEPAAYAICALEQYGFDPDDDEKIFYGIFDFGGGTTDFDFGIWRSANEDEDRYDYVINHFGAGGDKYLGGENLLRLLAFHVFKNNQDALRADGIAFQKPEECKRFPGSEMLLSESQEAKLNMKQLMEKLRPFWERSEGYEKLFANGELLVLLFDKNGDTKINYKLKVDKENLEKILHDRIEQGVRNFFESLKLTFANNHSQVDGMKGIHIFLAGNSSKSPIVKELFEKYIEEHTALIDKELPNGNGEYYFMYPPLGTKEAVEIQKQKQLPINEDDLTKPTGKTGVAFGLIEGRQGGVIKVISEKNTATDEIKFAYYIGRNRKKKFKPVLSREVVYGEWVRFVSAESSDFEFYVTELPEAASGELSIVNVKKFKGRVPIADADAHIYIRATAPTKVEYVVATEEGIQQNQYLCEISEKELQL